MLPPKQGRACFRNYVETDNADTMYDEVDGYIYTINIL